MRNEFARILNFIAKINQQTTYSQKVFELMYIKLLGECQTSNQPENIIIFDYQVSSFPQQQMILGISFHRKQHKNLSFSLTILPLSFLSKSFECLCWKLYHQSKATRANLSFLCKLLFWQDHPSKRKEFLSTHKNDICTLLNK